MLDPKLLRDKSTCEQLAKRLRTRGFELDVDKVLNFEAERKSLQTKTQVLQSERNILSKSIGHAKAKGETTEPLLAQVGQLGDELNQAESKLADLQRAIEAYYYTIPNLPHDSVPVGKDENDNQVIKTMGDIPAFSFKPKDHIELGLQLNWFDFEAAAKLSGARFVVMYNNAVRLHRALIHFMIDIHTREHGYSEVYVPYLVHAGNLYGTGQLPNLQDDQFITEGEGTQTHMLIPTAEVPVANLVRGERLNESDLPKQYVCHTPCFRREAGSYGKDTRGMIRQHQFEKVELVWVTKPEESEKALETLTEHAQTILQKLELPYQLVSLCTGDMGFAATKTYDLEVWFPSQKTYREISSCSNTNDFQARRMQARYRNTATGKNELVHTLNGSGLAVGRTLIAIMENYQTKDGHIRVPTQLQPYLNGDSVLT